MAEGKRAAAAPTHVTPDEALTLAESSSDRRVGRAYRYVLQHPDEAGPILARVAESRKGDVRSWAAALARKVLPRAERIRFLQPLTDDPWPFVREEAIAGIIDADPTAARPHLPQMRRWLKSDSRRQWAIHHLVIMRDVDSVPQLRRLAEQEKVVPYERYSAALAVLALEGHEQDVFRMISEHGDHAHRSQLAGIALAIGTSEAITILSQASARSPDDECRRSFAHALRLAEEKERLPK